MLESALVALSVVLRLVPHPPNFAPVGAVAVFSGRSLSIRLGIVLTFGAMFLADLGLSALHGHRLVSASTPFIYGAFAVQALLGYALRKMRGGSVTAAALGAGAFFALSNFGVWVSGAYGHSTAGLVACYAAAIPFFPATLLSNLLWTVVLVAVHRPLARQCGGHDSWLRATAAI